MKAILSIATLLGLTFALALLISSCSVDKEIISKSEFTKWSVNNDTIKYNGTAVAVYDHSEYELNPGHGHHAKPIQELSITQIGYNIKIDDLIKYIHTLHPRQKVEIVVPKH